MTSETGGEGGGSRGELFVFGKGSVARAGVRPATRTLWKRVVCERGKCMTREQTKRKEKIGAKKKKRKEKKKVWLEKSGKANGGERCVECVGVAVWCGGV